MFGTFENLPIEQAKLQTVRYLYKKTLWSLWINQFTYKFRLYCMALGIKVNGTPETSPDEGDVNGS